MKNKASLPPLSAVFFLMTVGLALLSWIGSLSGWDPVQSLLSEEGIRWELNHVVADYIQTPALGIVLVMLMGLGIGFRGGLYDAVGRMFRGQLSGKERRSLTLALSVALGYAVLVCLSIPMLRSVTGSLYHSPFQKGFFYILSFGLGVTGLVYGYASNRFRRMSQVIEGMACLIARMSGYFVTLFLVVQFFSVLSYTRFPEWLGVDDAVVGIAFQVCCYLPVLRIFRK